MLVLSLMMACSILSLVAASDGVAKITNHKIVPRRAEKLPSHNFPSSLHIVGTRGLTSSIKNSSSGLCVSE